MNLSHLLSHITAMIEAAHPKPVVAPQRLCRALLGIDDGRTEVGRVFDLAPNKEDGFHWRMHRTGDCVVSLTQLGNVPIVLRTVSCQGVAILSGAALKVRFEAKLGDEVDVGVRALE